MPPPTGQNSMPMEHADLAGLVPSEWWSRLAASLNDLRWQPHIDRAREAPLPEAAVRFYTGAGCWLLAAELQSLTQLPLGAELTPGGRAMHVFVIDGADAIDAMGRTSLEKLRKESEEVSSSVALGVSLTNMLATIDANVFTAEAGRLARQMLDDPEYRECAAEAARRVALATGLVVSGGSS
jgi:hypothetical protein